MKRKNYRSYALLLFLIFSLLNVPKSLISSLQESLVKWGSPLWKAAFNIRTSTARFLASHLSSRSSESATEGALFSSQEIEGGKDGLNRFSPSVMARVIYRQPSMWGSFVWIDVGEKETPLVQVNSPVLLDRALVGLVEFVGKKQSRVRLITDSSLVVAVRAIRGSEQKREILHLIDQLLLELSLLKEPILSSGEERALFEKLGILKKKLEKGGATQYLAKGEISGASSSLHRSLSFRLKGVGFNYDFEDDKGVARELLSGKPYEDFFKEEGVRLIQQGDLLVTSGMDGLFPEGIPVGIVVKVDPVKEGDVSFSIEVCPLSKKIHDLSRVYVLPSLNIEIEKEKGSVRN